MPEGHSVRRLANTFEQFFVGERCELSSPQGRFAAGAALLDGKVMTAVFSYGKHLFMKFEDLWLHTHLGLYGAWRFHSEDEGALENSIGAPRIDSGVLPYAQKDSDEVSVDEEASATEGGFGDEGEESSWFAPDPVGQVRVRIEAEKVAADLTGPMACEVLDGSEVTTILNRLGPDPLDTESDPGELRDEFVRLVRASKRTVGDLIMDQGISAGVGNIYRAEALFRQGISPNRRGANVSEERLKELWDDFVDLLHIGVETGDIITMAPEDVTAEDVVAEHLALEEASEEAVLEDDYYVYKRAGEPCIRCGNPVKHKVVSGRNLYWCSTCQR